jgi:uncharacterized protein YneF (UPF0154 family)
MTYISKVSSLSVAKTIWLSESAVVGVAVFVCVGVAVGWLVPLEQAMPDISNAPDINKKNALVFFIWHSPFPIL